MDMAKVTSKGQITIPISIRKRLQINEGDKLLFIDRPNGVLMVNPEMLSSEEKQSLSSEISSITDAANQLTDASLNEQDANANTSQTSSAGGGFDVAAALNEIRSIGRSSG